MLAAKLAHDGESVPSITIENQPGHQTQMKYLENSECAHILSQCHLFQCHLDGGSCIPLNPCNVTLPTIDIILPLRVPIPQICAVLVEVEVENDIINEGHCGRDSKDLNDRLDCVSKLFMSFSPNKPKVGQYCC